MPRSLRETGCIWPSSLHHMVNGACRRCGFGKPVDLRKNAPATYRLNGEVIGKIYGPYDGVYVPTTEFENATARRLDGVNRTSFTRAVYCVLASWQGEGN